MTGHESTGQSLANLVRAAASRATCPTHGPHRVLNGEQCPECAFERIEMQTRKAHAHITRALQILRRTETRGE
jgi:hypothetical protein